ncbi:MAG: NAD(P)/FAD-dependent oxidoreductase [Flavobacteriales bacterium]|nr:NAD(P)/FAD-dependent oxidoreductase [Flavobacteriales bacterium]
MRNRFDLIIVGGGAAGFFAAIHTAEKHLGIRVAIIEKTSQVLSKVKISGGGRCNLTNTCTEPQELIEFYPRGQKELLSAFYRFNTADTINWFLQKGVLLYAQDDGRVFPKSNSSQTIIDCFLKQAEKYKIQLQLNTQITEIKKENNLFILNTKQGINYSSTILLLAIGGNPHLSAYSFLNYFQHQIIHPVPSLFTFNLPQNIITSLMGLSMPEVCLQIKDTPFVSTGPLLITHWGVSGPVVLKLSAIAARYLAEKKYCFIFSINWLNEEKSTDASNELKLFKKQMSGKTISSTNPFHIPARLWMFLTLKAAIPQSKKYADFCKEEIEKLSEILTNDNYEVSGKTTFKEEFVTAGGVSLKEVNFKTMESKKIGNLFFAGEVLDIDGLTGGFNFQAAWTTAFIASESIAERMKHE